MKRPLLILVTTLLLAACHQGPVGNPSVPYPTRSVDLNRYAGTWYELGRYENRFEKGCEGVTAEYAWQEDGTISVINRCHQGKVDGPLDTAEGVAKIVPHTANTKLRVSFFGPFYGDYWVLDHGKDYSWSIVGEPTGRYLWLLFRKPHPSEKLKKHVWARAKALGYDTTLIRETEQ